MLTMICGIPNAGKTTYSQRFGNALHQDELGAMGNIVGAIGRMDGDIIIEGYFGTSRERRRVLGAHEGQSKCIFIDITVEESIRREDRNRNPQILRNAARFFEPPTYDEGWDEIEVIR